MSQSPELLYAMYVEGETKTGKGAASQAIANALKDQGVSVYYDVAGDFFRRYVAIVRRELNLGEEEALPPRPELEAIAAELYATGKAFSLEPELGDLQRPAISRSVSLLGELPVAQAAAVDWYGQSVKQAVESGARVMILDGRNPRLHVEKHVRLPNTEIKTIFDLYMTCKAEVAARRALLGEGVSEPTSEQLIQVTKNIEQRRSLDRQRQEWPFWWPEINLPFVPGEHTVRETVTASWEVNRLAASPLPIVIDNSYVPKPIMWTAVVDLAIGALSEVSTAV